MLTIEVATADEVGLVHEVIQKAFSEYLGAIPMSAHKETIADILHRFDQEIILVGRDLGEAVASARIRLRGPTAELARIGVEPGKRRKGYGSDVLLAAEGVAAALGARETILFTPACLRSLQAFYLERGYRASGHRWDSTNGYFDLEMRKALGGEERACAHQPRFYACGSDKPRTTVSSSLHAR